MNEFRIVFNGTNDNQVTQPRKCASQFDKFRDAWELHFCPKMNNEAKTNFDLLFPMHFLRTLKKRESEA